jgi:sphinganine-1-phosphate aldolase
MTARLPERGRSWSELAREMTDLKRDDLDWRRGRHAAFVWHADEAVETVAREAYALFMTENGLGMRVFPSLRRMESDVVAMVANLVGGDASVVGHMTSGGTESIFLAAHAAREWARKHRPEITAPEIVAAFSAHPAIDKAAHYLGMGVVRVPTAADFRADVAAMAAAVTPRTVMCYASAPTYSLGVVDPVAALGALAAERGLWLHVDACVGGVLGPFVASLVIRCRRSAWTGQVCPRSPPISTSRAMPPRAPRSSSTGMRHARSAGAMSSATGQPDCMPCPRSLGRGPVVPSPPPGRS